MKTNKEVIQDLTNYFIKQPPQLTCRFLANLIIDFNRICHIDQLGEEEKKNLMYRVQWNLDQLKTFIENGPQGDFEIENKE